MKPEVQHALKRYLLTVADDEIVIGYRDSEWTGIAPIVEEDIAFSSLAQDEIGHARLYYTLVAELTGKDADHLALLREKDAYYHAQLLEQRATPKYHPSGDHEGGGDWAFAVARRFLYDLFDDLRIQDHTTSSYAPLAGAARKIQREERYHLKHGEVWWETLATGSLEARERLERALERMWPDLLGLFEAAPGEDLLVAEGILPRTTANLLEPWLERAWPYFDRYSLPFPGNRGAQGWELSIQAAQGGRQGRHGPGWDELYEEMTMVRRIEPEGVW